MCFTKLNQYKSLILLLVKHTESHGVRSEYGMDMEHVGIVTVGNLSSLKNRRSVF
ncbi:MAG: hypothetical protein ACI4O7_13090 [Aristaeellaceae bacterium]